MATSSVRAPITMRLPFAASSVAIARQQLKDWMSRESSSRDAIEDARVVVSELVANAVRHARPLPDGQILVTWTMAGHDVELSVTDGGGSTAPHNVKAPPTATSGRGMAIVDTLADDWWTERDDSATTVFARLRR